MISNQTNKVAEQTKTNKNHKTKYSNNNSLVVNGIVFAEGERN